MYNVNNFITCKCNFIFVSRVKIPSAVPIKYETEIETESDDRIEMMNKYRKDEVEAAIIRVMKAKKNIRVSMTPYKYIHTQNNYLCNIANLQFLNKNYTGTYYKYTLRF